MEPLPKNCAELNLLIDSLLTCKGSELTRGNILANFKAKSNPDFIKFLEGFYGERWSHSMGQAALAAAKKIERTVDNLKQNIYRKKGAQSIVTLLNEQYTLPVPSGKRTHSEIEISDPPSVGPDTPPATPKRFEPESSSYITPKRSKLCSTCPELRHESSDLRKELKYARTEAEKLRAKVKQRPSVLGQTIKRLEQQLKTQKSMHEASKAKARTDAKVLRTLYNEAKSKAKRVVNAEVTYFDLSF